MGLRITRTFKCVPFKHLFNVWVQTLTVKMSVFQKPRYRHRYPEFPRRPCSESATPRLWSVHVASLLVSVQILTFALCLFLSFISVLKRFFSLFIRPKKWVFLWIHTVLRKKTLDLNFFLIGLSEEISFLFFWILHFHCSCIFTIYSIHYYTVHWNPSFLVFWNN